jgi:class 3 adenylate cyclase
MERSIELRGLLLGLYDAWTRGEQGIFTELFSTDDNVLAIGSDPAEWWPGGRNAAAIFEHQIEEMGRMKLEATNLQAFCSGDVGWIADEPLIHLESGLSFQGRLTIVFERQNGAWKMVQWHFSIGQTNQDAIGMELTTSVEALAEWARLERPDLERATASDGTVTIMFTDIEGSTALNEQLGDAQWADVVKSHDGFMRSVVSSYDGTTVQRMGDGFMLAFPSARKGIDCAIAIQQGMKQDANGFRVRIGAHTGEPIRESGEFYGRDVAYAARVSAAADGGEILVSDLVARLCAGTSFRFHGPRTFEFKGFEGPQPVFAVDWSERGR